MAEENFEICGPEMLKNEVIWKMFSSKYFHHGWRKF